MNLLSKYFYKKYDLIDRNVATCRSRLSDAEQMSSDELYALNWKRRVELVNFCSQRIPFYIRKFDEIGFSSGDLKSEVDFQNLPVLEKDEIRECADEIVCPDFSLNNLKASSTGGTTGLPLTTYSDPSVHLSSMSWRMLNWWDVDASDNSAYLYRVIPTGLRKMASDMVLFPTRRTYISAADMTVENMDAFYKRLKKTKPKYLVGYVGAIEEFANYMMRHEGELPSLKAIWTTSAPLPECKRVLYEKAFKCPVYTQYGSGEFYWIAAECKNQCGLHVASDVRHVEVVEGDQPVNGEGFGDLLVTDLLNYAFPLLRYRLGDRGRMLPEKCECGLPFPIMDYVKGRISDSIRFPDGTTIPGEYWTTIFDDFTDVIRAFQVYQASDYSIEIRYEVYDGVDCCNAISVVEQGIGGKLRGRARLTFKNCEISSNDFGKLKFVISDVC